MPLTTQADQAVLNAIMRGAALGAPAKFYVGLLGAPTWAATTVYATGAYAVGTAFASANPHIYKATTGGTSGGTEPAWNEGAGQTTNDGSVVWTEVTNLFQAGTFTGAELSGGGYARVEVDPVTGNWTAATAAQPSAIQNVGPVNCPTPTATWVQVVGFILSDAATAGNIWWWGPLTGAVLAGIGSSPSFAANALTVTLE